MMMPMVAEPPSDSQTSFCSLSRSIAGTAEDYDSVIFMNTDWHCRSTASGNGGSKSTGTETAGDEPNSLVTSSVSLLSEKIW